MKQKLLFARAYEKEAAKLIPPSARPLFHLTPYTGWMNDPNGFSFYQGKFHMFYQYYPYDTAWNDMHWGHAVSTDLLHWEYLPAIMAPDKPYDGFGCFSGSAIELDDGRQLLLYTGVCKEGGESDKDIQTQCVAVGDGLDYKKIPQNPVLTERDLPEGCEKYNFRDPRIWRDPDGTFFCIVGSCDENGLGKLLRYRSPDGFQWTYDGMLIENDGRLGLMWECPDYFELDGKQVLLVSPQDMLPEGFEYHNGNGTVCMIGHFDPESRRFVPESDHAVDYGIDFYAPTTIRMADGRRVMIGWMQNWDTTKLSSRKDFRWFGQMSLPREISIRNGRLYQQPLRELEAFRRNPVRYENVRFADEIRLDGVSGRIVDMTVTVRPVSDGPLYHTFAIRFMQNERFHSELSYRSYESILRIDRKFSGSRRAYIHQRRCLVPNRNGEIKLRMILDRFSAEVFINDGEQTVTATIFTDLNATDISFIVDGEAVMDVEKYDLVLEASDETV